MTKDNERGLSPTSEEQAPTGERRSFLKWLGLAAAVAVGGAAGGTLAEAAGSRQAPPQQKQGVALTIPSAPGSTPGRENILLRMQADLQRALAKPLEQRRWIMVIDLRKCIGCSSCTVACKAENQLPPGVVYRPVIEEEIGSYPNVSRRFTPRPCMQCENPPCTQVCPVGATFKRPDGIVEIDYNVCIGCRYCINACPYSARTFDSGFYYTKDTPEEQPYEKQANFEYGKRWNRAQGSPIGNARKCTFCLHRLEAGMLPACTTTCIGGATYFGDANLPDSLVSELVASPNVMRLKEELGTNPKVYYLA
jgi:molybdopterin-containing oxidoreductase family iron-sulfur binding subunit